MSRLLRYVCAVAVLAAVLISLTVSRTAAQGPRMTPDRLNQLASKATPRLGEHADLNGTWDHLGGIEFVQPRKLANGSVCIIGCPPEPGAGGARAGGPPPTPFPKYKPQFAAKVKELNERQVDTDTVL